MTSTNDPGTITRRHTDSHAYTCTFSRSDELRVSPANHYGEMQTYIHDHRYDQDSAAVWLNPEQRRHLAAKLMDGLKDSATSDPPEPATIDPGKTVRLKFGPASASYRVDAIHADLSRALDDTTLRKNVWPPGNHRVELSLTATEPVTFAPPTRPSEQEPVELVGQRPHFAPEGGRVSPERSIAFDRPLIDRFADDQIRDAIRTVLRLDREPYRLRAHPDGPLAGATTIRGLRVEHDPAFARSRAYLDHRNDFGNLGTLSVTLAPAPHRRLFVVAHRLMGAKAEADRYLLCHPEIDRRDVHYVLLGDDPWRTLQGVLFTDHDTILQVGAVHPVELPYVLAKSDSTPKRVYR